ncbi:MAG: HAD family hydrolase [Acidimicrobiales bacterium]
MSDVPLRRGLRAVVFDIGETLVDETRAWTVEAARSGVSTLTLFAALGALIERGADHRGVWDLLGVAPPASPVPLQPADLYPDAVECLTRLADAGYILGLAGNQPAETETVLMAMGLPLSLVASSASWGIDKPSAEFFARIATALELPCSQIAYVGDRLDNDVIPAKQSGLFSVFVRRGPWGYLHSSLADVVMADLRVESLTDLPSALGPADKTV